MVGERDKAILKQGEMLQARWAIIQSMDAEITSRGAAIAQGKEIVSDLKKLCAQIASPIKSHPFEIMSISQSVSPFQELAYSLFLFTRRLHSAASQGGATDLLFFAREGKLLKKMFDYYQQVQVDLVPLKTHYLEVSRKSTFLLSLGPLESETFQVLFRQYRRISIEDFLKSLALEEYMQDLAGAIGEPLASLTSQCDDLPTDPLFDKLLKSESFRSLYETQRVSRSQAFEKYAASMLGGEITQKLHVIDVGWKGSIQDNVYNWLVKIKGKAAQIQGYYLGLVATGSLSDKNKKEALLFSNIQGISPGFHIFNENRSLFEMLLHADHGSARSYILADNGSPAVISDTYHEQEMIERKIKPMTDAVWDLFKKIALLPQSSHLSDAEFFSKTLDKHARMVFHPTAEEIHRMLDAGHFENFGVFNKSKFGSHSKISGIIDRLNFTWSLVKNRRLGEIGFWPWLTIRQKAFWGTEHLYGHFRKKQEFIPLFRK